MEARFPRRLTLLLIILCLVLHLPHFPSSGTMTFKVNGPAQRTVTCTGQDVLLSCHLSPKMDAQDMMIKWFRSQDLVHRYYIWKKVVETQGPGFEGRTELLKHDLAKGNVTLRIRKVQLSDSGNYTCHFRSPYYYNEAHFELQVAENPPTSQETLPLPLKLVLLSAVWIVVPVCLVFGFWVYVQCR
ncbi:myelin-oligodendrocyte glycoprotein-like [Dromiciops gliroides]|uniref:myelin-oligodendrocyte glycoprotein-like n=1 Tax=Dromiciops gliroides TaxID=33562 RepID=UPI001CC47DE2|nr:myelin-oligodendrocyte glycoprotein-like [Dromiciops gliroides]